VNAYVLHSAELVVSNALASNFQLHFALVLVHSRQHASRRQTGRMSVSTSGIPCTN